MNNKLIKTEIKNILLLLVASIFSFFSLHIFVIPSNFSPSGIDGVSTILFEITGINIGWFKLIFNIPLLILALIHLKKRYVAYVITFTLLDSIGMIILEKLNFYTFIPENLNLEEQIGYRLISAIFAGVALGVCVAILLKIGSSSGGIDIIASIINLKKPNYNVETIVSVICYIVIGCSYFVYRDLTSILLSVIQIFVFEWTTASLMRKERFATEIKIITKTPEVIKEEVLNNLSHSATIVKATGMFSDTDYFMVVTVINSKSVPQFMTMMKSHTDCFIYLSDGIKVQGDFHFGNKKGSHISAF